MSFYLLEIEDYELCAYHVLVGSLCLFTSGKEG